MSRAVSYMCVGEQISKFNKPELKKCMRVVSTPVILASLVIKEKSVFQIKALHREVSSETTYILSHTFECTTYTYTTKLC